jgi:D-lactate dehydrogenase (cytochrome)
VLTTRSASEPHGAPGNFHAFILFRNDQELEVVRGAVHRLVHRALALDGTCTGEHGIGVGKKEYLVEELGEGTVALMRQIKKAIDPLNLFNPGKVRLRLSSGSFC